MHLYHHKDSQEATRLEQWAQMSRCQIFVTGSPGVGKSTLIQRVLNELQQQYPDLKAHVEPCAGGSAASSAEHSPHSLASQSPGLAAACTLLTKTTGFYTEEVRQGGERLGFDVVTLDGRRGPLARAGGWLRVRWRRRCAVAVVAQRQEGEGAILHVPCV